jgi:hypothetical protein
MLVLAHVKNMTTSQLVIRSEIPPRDTRRWSPDKRKAVARAIISGAISRDEAKSWYNFSDDEIDIYIARLRAGDMTLLSRKYRQVCTSP